MAETQNTIWIVQGKYRRSDQIIVVYCTSDKLQGYINEYQWDYPPIAYKPLNEGVILVATDD